jgi:predicted DNA-binding mobile mystery protein A
MKARNKLLIIRQLDAKMQNIRPLQKLPVPSRGWVHLIRDSLNMSLRQLGNRLSITPQGIKDIEKREAEGTITLNALKQVGDALGLQLVYGFVPKDDSIEKMIERKASTISTKIVQRTSTSMKLEDQENGEDRIKQAISELADEIKRDLPKNLWD